MVMLSNCLQNRSHLYIYISVEAHLEELLNTPYIKMKNITNIKRPQNPETIRLQLMEHLETLRTAASVSHLSDLDENIISRVKSIGELVNLTVECGDGERHINLAKYLICLYHLLFPVQQTS